MRATLNAKEVAAHDAQPGPLMSRTGPLQFRKAIPLKFCAISNAPSGRAERICPGGPLWKLQIVQIVKWRRSSTRRSSWPKVAPDLLLRSSSTSAAALWMLSPGFSQRTPTLQRSVHGQTQPQFQIQSQVTIIGLANPCLPIAKCLVILNHACNFTQLWRVLPYARRPQTKAFQAGGLRGKRDDSMRSN